jgi:hypothetical protein
VRVRDDEALWRLKTKGWWEDENARGGGEKRIREDVFSCFLTFLLFCFLVSVSCIVFAVFFFCLSIPPRFRFFFCWCLSGLGILCSHLFGDLFVSCFYGTDNQIGIGQSRSDMKGQSMVLEYGDFGIRIRGRPCGFAFFSCFLFHSSLLFLFFRLWGFCPLLPFSGHTLFNSQYLLTG